MRRYLFTLILVVTTALLLGSVLVWMVNPNWLWTVPESLALVDPNSPRPLPNQRLAKAWHIWNRKPDGLIIGSSRSEFGLDPDHPGWKAGDVYNASLAGTTILELRRYLQHAYSINQITQLVVNLEFSMFAAEIPLVAPTFDDDYLRVRPDNTKNGNWRQLSRWQPLVSVDGWLDALSVFGNYSTIVRDERFFLPDGQREPTYYWYKEIATRGHRSAFERSTVKIANEYYDWFSDGTLSPAKIEEFRRILQFAYGREIDFHVILSPVHAWLIEVYYRQGTWQILEEWKRMVVATNIEIAAVYGATPAPVWDFIDYNAFTTEPIPPAGDRDSRMNWFWEASHYRAELGTVILDRVFDVETITAAEKDTLGTLVTPENIEEHLRNVRMRRAQYAKRIGPELAFLDRFIKEHND